MITDEPRDTGDKHGADSDIIDELVMSSPPKDLRTLIASGHAVETALAEEHLRRRAYDLWEAAGRPPGDGTEFWAAAQRELDEARKAHGHLTDPK